MCSPKRLRSIAGRLAWSVVLVTPLALAWVPMGCATAGAAPQDCPACPPCEAAPCEAEAKKARAPMKAPDDSVSDNDPTRMRMRAFSADSTLAAIEVNDDRGGLYLRIVTLKDGSAVRTYRFDEASARSVWKKARRKHGLLERGPQTAAHPKLEALTLMGSDTADAVLVNVAKGERVVPYLRIRRLPEAAVAFKTLAFSPDGKRLVAIHTQTRVVGGRQIAHDFFHTVPFKQYRLPF